MAEKEFADALQSSLSFGRPGHGAPLTTKSGRVRAQISGDPVIRFQSNQNVHKSVENGIRYYRGRKDQDEYKNELDILVKKKMSKKVKDHEMKIKQEEEHDKNYPFGHVTEGGLSVPMVSAPDPIFILTSPRHLKPHILSYEPWSKGIDTPYRDSKSNALSHLSPINGSEEPLDLDNLGSSIPMGKYSGGNGAPHVTNILSPANAIVTKLPCTLSRGCAKDLLNDLTVESRYRSDSELPTIAKEKQTFLQKLGWDDDSKMSDDAKKIYLQELKIAIEDKNVNQRKEDENNKYGGVELAQLIREKKVDYPTRKELQLYGLGSTDITKSGPLSCPILHWSNAEYREELNKQRENRMLAEQKIKEQDLADSFTHFETWDSLWGRRGHGAPKDPNNHRKEGVGYLYRTHSKIPVLPAGQFSTLPINHQVRHRSLSREKKP
ncbi:hypothetical protein CHUAL_010389 [Chamberlinius hualienensis]